MTTIYTIGHGSRTIGELMALLREAGIECLADVRAYPASRRHPHFAREALERSLAETGIRYVWEGVSLGGRRLAVADSPHLALKEPAFRAYADHMGTAQFRQGAARLTALAGESRIALMCAERLPWECHRHLISDHLVAAGRQVVHLVDPGPGKPHQLNRLARLRGGVLVYDGETQGRLDW
jgi:uncharacterized protein (DUF488 family)